ncbi:hypothetical protein AVEN_223786-1 [Araneus ventricosus]|uniref:Mutator-like transposase domain-containing protein n=1 Tax=Araneus ventricosus TaxID=182803 RepID=A0A4Y2DKB1_ARAVE|nr:hypothetical protein AVEN_223786-1 [Araneus ventricosus]
MNVLKTLLNTVSKCKHCNSTDCFDVLEETNSRRGLTTSLVFICKSCGCSSSSKTSYISENGYDINTILVYGMRCIGNGKCAVRTLCAVMNLSPPPAKFERLNSSLCRALSSACSKSMLKAIEGAVSRNDNSRDITVALDGTWQKRGHTSINGVITATSLDTGKVIDFQCLCKYCFICKNKSNDCKDCQKKLTDTMLEWKVKVKFECFSVLFPRGTFVMQNILRMATRKIFLKNQRVKSV